MSEDTLFTLVAIALALPIVLVDVLAVIVVWNFIDPFRRRW